MSTDTTPAKTASAKPNDLLEDLHRLVAEAEKMIGDTFTQHSEEAVGALRARFEGAQERLSEMADGARRRVVAGARCADHTIRANPYQSLAIAAGAGLLIGVLLGRRSK